MKYPYLSELPATREMISVFGGYNHNLRINDGEFYEMKNLSSDDYPLLSPRAHRGVYATPDSPQGMISKDSMCYVDGSDFVINEKRIDMKLSTAEADCPKTLVSMGGYVIIMPDKKWINTTDFKFGNIEATVTTTTKATITHCKLDGTDFADEDITISNEAPGDPENLAYWIDTSTSPHTLKQYSETSATWIAIATTYIKITATGIGAPFEVGDGVFISGVQIDGFDDVNSTILQGCGDDYIIIIGILDEVKTQDTAITIKRQMPNMDFIIESENRLWGCRYGLSVNNEVVNEIYASKLGDFKNWNCFAGISTDSYAVSLGSDGQFTGAITHRGFPLFFKETCMHKVYGNYPANYQIQTTTCRGVQKGSERSLAIVNEDLYYKSRTSVCYYDGSLPTEISAALGDISYYKAVGGTLGNKYYISMADADGVYHLFVYDTKKGVWHKEDNTQAMEFCNCRGELYYIDNSDKQIKTVKGTGTPDTTAIEWEAITGIIGTDSPDKKYISRIDVRLSLKLGTTVYFFVQYDSSGVWEKLHVMTGISLKSFSVPIRPKRCDHLQLRIVGTGEAKIYSICKTIEQGSDL